MFLISTGFIFRIGFKLCFKSTKDDSMFLYLSLESLVHEPRVYKVLRFIKVLGSMIFVGLVLGSTSSSRSPFNTIKLKIIYYIFNFIVQILINRIVIWFCKRRNKCRLSHRVAYFWKPRNSFTNLYSNLTMTKAKLIRS